MDQQLESKLKVMAKGFLNKDGDAIDLLNLLMRVDVQTKVVEIEKPVIVEKIVEKIVVKVERVEVPVEVPTTVADMLSDGKDLYTIIAEVERTVILSALTEAGWNRKKSSKVLKTSYRNLLYKIKQHKLEPQAPTPVNAFIIRYHDNHKDEAETNGTETRSLSNGSVAL